jgi:predicted ArsR family transcriptional regulator
MTRTRKRHVHVDQREMGGYVSMRDAVTLAEVIDAFEISETTARRHLDGLVAQNLLEVWPADPLAGRERIYAVPGTIV